MQTKFFLRLVPITGSQVRMARAALQMSVGELAAKASISPNTVTQIEAGEEAWSAYMTVIQRTLEAADVEFIADDGRGPGVRLKRQPIPAGRKR
jgi:transcriptional regulator with XRE-family HTH domain